MSITRTTGLSAHFKVSEFDCHNGARVPVAAYRALERWCAQWGEPMRKRFGAIRITSGYRPAAYNASVGGAPASYHRYELHHPARDASRITWDLAADVVPATGDVQDWQTWASAVLARGMQGFGRSNGAAVGYPASGFIHLDTGPRRSWAG